LRRSRNILGKIERYRIHANELRSHPASPQIANLYLPAPDQPSHCRTNPLEEEHKCDPVVNMNVYVVFHIVQSRMCRNPLVWREPSFWGSTGTSLTRQSVRPCCPVSTPFPICLGPGQHRNDGLGNRAFESHQLLGWLAGETMPGPAGTRDRTNVSAPWPPCTARPRRARGFAAARLRPPRRSLQQALEN
jgi:hypothetical protein